MNQPVRGKSNKPRNNIRKKGSVPKNRKGKKIGTSKLEIEFASQFLDKLNVDYVWQFEAKSIGRFYDYAIPEQHLLIEVDGGYYHSDPRVVNEKQMNPMQKHNKRVDKIKDEWAALNGFVLLRIWEHDIKNNPAKVMDRLKKYISAADKKKKILQERKKPH